MIYTITLNPGVDLQYTVEKFEYNVVTRSIETRRDLGGKGFNVSNALSKLEVPSIALGFVGGKNGEFLVDQLERLRIDHDLIWIEGESRTNTTILKAGENVHLKVNESGPQITIEEQHRLLDKASNLARENDLFILSGSLPPGVTADYYAQIIRVVQNQGARALLDTSAEALIQGLKANPFLCKPNRIELQQITGITLVSKKDYKVAILTAHEMGVSRICLSLGSEGAVLSDGKKMIIGTPPKIQERNPIAAGDALLAGIAAGLKSDLENGDILRLSIACGTAAASLDGTSFGSKEMVASISEQIKISEL